MEISQKLELSYSPTNPLLGIFIQRICCYSVAKSCLTLCNPVDRSPPGSSVHGVLLARILEWADISSSRVSSPPWEQTCISSISCTLAGGFFTTEPLGKPRIITTTIITPYVRLPFSWKEQTRTSIHHICSLLEKDG